MALAYVLLGPALPDLLLPEGAADTDGMAETEGAVEGWMALPLLPPPEEGLAALALAMVPVVSPGPKAADSPKEVSCTMSSEDMDMEAPNSARRRAWPVETDEPKMTALVTKENFMISI